MANEYGPTDKARRFRRFKTSHGFLRASFVGPSGLFLTLVRDGGFLLTVSKLRPRIASVANGQTTEEATHQNRSILSRCQFLSLVFFFLMQISNYRSTTDRLVIPVEKSVLEPPFAFVLLGPHVAPPPPPHPRCRAHTRRPGVPHSLFAAA